MKDYVAPLEDMRFVINELSDLSGVLQLSNFKDVSPDVVDALLDEAARFASGVLSPLNRVGDRQGATFADGRVTTALGWRQAYEAYSQAGWSGLVIPAAHGGQGLPRIVDAAVNEIWSAANLSFALCPMLTVAAIEALILRGSDELKARYLPKLLSGEWSGTMNLTEPQAGSDLAQIRTRAEPAADGTYRITGQKIYITYGEHDLTENIIHMVLARLPDAPEGVRGISLFLVPKVLVNADGALGARNDVQCVSIEHKLGIHGSPTCVLSYGEQGGAVGYLVGEANRGLEIMFIMMNAARFGVGLEGLALAERAYQAARDYARERVQSVPPGGRSAAPIIEHPDVRRMLMTMRAQVEAMRAVSYVVAGAMDQGAHSASDALRVFSQQFAELMIPVVKGWCTETAVEVASLGVQVHGGMGYIEETGAAQFLRDARITPIYEGTTAIQANDLVGRKLGRYGAAAMRAMLSAMHHTVAALAVSKGPDFAAIRTSLTHAVEALSEAEEHLLEQVAKNPRDAYAGSVPFLKLMGVTAGGWQLARAALAASRRLKAGQGDAQFYQAKITTARFYADHILTQAGPLAYAVMHGAPATLALPAERF